MATKERKEAEQMCEDSGEETEETAEGQRRRGGERKTRR